MAEIVLGVGTSHSPMLSLAPEHWDIRTQADMDAPAHPHRGKWYSFDELLEIQPREHYRDLNRIEVREERYARCQVGLDALADAFAEAKPDVLVIIGDDQKELFLEDVQPAFAVSYGDKVMANGFDADNPGDVPEPMIPVRQSYRPPEDRDYAVETALADRIIGQAMADGFDVAASARQPVGPEGEIGIGHAFIFVYRRILKDRPVPMVPVFINTYYPPNQPTAKRCYDFGRLIGRAIKGWNSDARVAVAASGGLTHFVIDEELDLRLLDAMQKADAAALTADPNSAFQSGTSEIKNWIAAAGAMAEAGLGMNLVDYVPCYRSEAGTGTAMAFATWS